ncbi:DNA primase [Pseudoramibacter alactolyticus]|uniref:DNA primase n=1 Tax=Pseudoramibacter alactolyticus TaxID=113287 RepID=UPI0028EAF525|nr:DNA primase [Pseudoramibacter alactolyticus]
MPKYSEEIIQRVIEANDIIDVVSQYVQLKKSGHSYMGCCPFHNERTPSFSVSQDKQLYHCFGCGVGGNVISFVMDKENMSFPEAIQYLAERANIHLPKSTSEDDAKYQRKETLYELNRVLANHYYTLLKHQPDALAYLKERGIDIRTIKTFGLGYAADQWREACQYLTARQFKIDDIVDSGVEIKNDRGRFYDRFRNRLMIPIQNTRDKIIGFGGRILSNEEHGSKYLNSPESLIFSKGTELFNLNRAKKNIVDNQLVVVEGYMDVIALYQRGVKNTVAALGTAFTSQHAKLLSRYVDEIILCFDGDQAGENATNKAIAILKNSPLKIKVVRLNAEDDPDSYIRRNGVDAFRQQVREAQTAIEYQLTCLKKDNPLKTNDDRLTYVSQAVPIIREARSDIEKNFFSKLVAQSTGISAKMIYNAAIKNIGYSEEQIMPAFKKYLAEQKKKTPKAVLQAEKNIIIGLLNQTIPFNALDLTESHFSDAMFRQAFHEIKKCYQERKPMTGATVIAALDQPEAQQALTALIMESSNGEASPKESIRVLKQYKDAAAMCALQKKLKTLDPSDPEVARTLNALMELKKRKDNMQEVEDGR